MEAQFRLANLFALGQGTPKSHSRAYDWYTKAALQGYSKALVRLHNLNQEEKSMYCHGSRHVHEYAEWDSYEELLEERLAPNIKLQLSRFKEHFLQEYDSYKNMEEYDQNALLNMGLMFHHGYGVNRSIKKAIYYYFSAVERYDSDIAQYNLGKIYQQHQQDTRKNRKKVFEWYSNAAINGCTAAQSALGQLYHNGIFVERDYSQALFWYSKAADKRFTFALLNLGKMHRKGQGTTEDLHEAMKYYKLAAREGSMVAQNCLDQLLLQQNITPDKMENTELEEYKDLTNKRRMRSLLRKHITRLDGFDNEASLKNLAMTAMMGDRNAMYEIGIKYQDGLDLPQDDELSFQWMKRAGRENLPKAQIRMGKFYEKPGVGDIVDTDYYKASVWYKKGASRKHHELQFHYGRMYYRGRGVQNNDLMAFKWFTLSAEQGNSDSQCYLGRIKINGEGCLSDEKEAFDWYKKSIYQNNPKAMYRIAQLYYDKEDLEEGIRFYKYALKHGYKGAPYKLLRIYNGLLSKGGGEKYLPSKLDIEKAFWNEFNNNINISNTHWRNVAQYYLEGKVVKKNYIKAYLLLRRQREMEGYESVVSRYFSTPITLYLGENFSYDLLKMFEDVTRKGIEDLEHNIGYAYEFGIRQSDHVKALVNADLPEARKWYIAASEKGDSRAQYRLGVIYEEGKGVKADLDTAICFYTKAIENDHPDAMYRLSCLYLRGHGVQQDFEKSFQLFARAHDMGQKHCQLFLKIIVQTDQDQDQDTEWGLPTRENEEYEESEEKYYADEEESASLSLRMLTTVAFNGNIALQYRLGSLYEVENQFVMTDFSKAVYWYTLASQNGVTEASYRLGVLCENGKGIEQNYNEAARLYNKASEKQHERALCSLAQLFHYGRGVQVDLQKASDLYAQAALQDNELAQKIVSMIKVPGCDHMENCMHPALEIEIAEVGNLIGLYEYLASHGNTHLQVKLGILYESEQDYLKAFEWYLMSGSASHTYGMYCLGKLHEEGLGATQSYVNAFEMYNKASKQGCAEAAYRLGDIYQHGLGVAVDTDRALSYYAEAANKGNADAQYRLGQIYSTQKNTSDDIFKALEWFTKSYLQGNDNAMELLYSLYIDNTPYELVFYNRLFNNLVKYTNNQDMYLHIRDYADPSKYYKLSCMYLTGTGTQIDEEKAWELFSIVLKSVFGSYGPGVSRDFCDYFNESIFEFYRIAKTKEKSNDIYANVLLGYIYLGGMVLKQDRYRPDKKMNPCIFRENGNFTSNSLPNNPHLAETTLVSTNYKLAHTHLLKAAECDNEFSKMLVAQMYHCGYGVKQDFTKSFSWYDKVGGDTGISMTLTESSAALLYAFGDGVAQDLQYLYRNSSLYSGAGCYNLAQLYYHGQLVSQSYKMAFHYLSGSLTSLWRNIFQVTVKINQKKSSELSSKTHREYLMVSYGTLQRETRYQLGIMLENGQGTRRDYKRAFKLLSKAMDDGSIEAKNHLETHYKDGIYIGDKIKQN
jgi:TPR repeat protein